MTKKCIICGGPAGSAEHIFPSVFGGRRTNKGIYCGKHNNEFGRHVAAVLEALDIFNSVVGVIPSGSDEVRPSPASIAGGDRYLVTKGTWEIAPPLPMRDTPELEGKVIPAQFSDQRQIARWVAEQARDGYKVVIRGSTAPRERIIAGPGKVSKTFGDDRFMRGVAYLALTFLAHGFPKLVRTPGIAGIRELVEKDTALDNRVWWEPPAVIKQLTANPFRYGHTIAIGPSPDGRHLLGLVCFYGALHLAVDLGDAGEPDLAERFTTHIDPLAERPPKDIDVHREPGACLQLGTPEEGREYLKQVVSGQAPNPIQALMHATREDSLLETCEELLPELVATKAVDGQLQLHRIMELLSGQRQRIFNLMHSGVPAFIQATPNFPQAIHEALRILVGTDSREPNGITPPAAAALQIATAALTDEIRDRVNDDSLEIESLALLLDGAEGLGVILKLLVGIVADAMPRPGTGRGPVRP